MQWLFWAGGDCLLFNDMHSAGLWRLVFIVLGFVARCIILYSFCMKCTLLDPLHSSFIKK
ncbi:hypothetical protein BDV11DRAFT_29544 [Aspergillus similis]